MTSSSSSCVTPTSNNAQLLFVLLGSIVSSVGIILLNKIIMVNFGFPFIILLTGFHFLVCKTVFYLMSSVHAIKTFDAFRNIESREVWTIAALGVGGIVLMNVSLQLNSIGLYQLLKLLTIPCMVVIQTTWYGKTFSQRVQICLLVLLMGIGIATVTDVQLNFAGSIVGIFAVIATSLGQILIGDRKNHYKMSSIQFLEVIMGAQAIMALAASLVFEFILPSYMSTGESPLLQLMPFFSNTKLMAYLLFSCIIAITTNLFGISLIGATSPVTFQVVGHGKTILVFVFGFLLFPSFKSTSEMMYNVIGIMIAMGGVIAYGYYMNLDNKEHTSQKPGV